MKVRNVKFGSADCPREFKGLNPDQNMLTSDIKWALIVIVLNAVWAVWYNLMNKYGIEIQTGERVSVAVKTCKDCTADVKEKFMSEAGKAFFILTF